MSCAIPRGMTAQFTVTGTTRDGAFKCPHNKCSSLKSAKSVAMDFMNEDDYKQLRIINNSGIVVATLTATPGAWFGLVWS